MALRPTANQLPAAAKLPQAKGSNGEALQGMQKATLQYPGRIVQTIVTPVEHSGAKCVSTHAHDPLRSRRMPNQWLRAQVDGTKSGKRSL